ncbi:MAG: dUTPase [Fibromonadaceae bacterium]|jgi:dimeric dUTPase (all-alpha-NTP-PPase superfamily)|nr:dUTPase [Fibromonadaceae bacterium]
MQTSDKLEELFRLQETLNDFVFAKQDLRDKHGNLLTMATLREQAKSEEPLGPNTKVNEWLRKYLEALTDESKELGEELLWKWWSKDKLNMQNIRVEIVDQLHFWLSLAITAGMDAEKVFDIYMQKNKVNIERQNSSYSKETKSEADNKGIN